MTDPSMNPDEPRTHKLPSGLEVTIRSHRSLRRADIHKVWAAGNNADEGLSAPAQHDVLIGLLVESTSDPAAYPVPLTPDALDRLDGADYTALYRLMDNGWRLANGLSIIPNPDEWPDPTRPRPESSGTSPDSGDSPSSPSTDATGTTSGTTSTSTEPEGGLPAS